MNSLDVFVKNPFSSFITKKIIPRLPKKNLAILDIGGAPLSAFSQVIDFFSDHQLNIDVIDINELAILNSFSNAIFNYKLASIVNYNSLMNYDLVFDSHALHCLKNIEEWDKSIVNISKMLIDGGLFASQMMIKSGEGVEFKNRLILDSNFIENKFDEYGFEIIYFYVLKDFYFLDSNSMEKECNILEIIAKKKAP